MNSTGALKQQNNFVTTIPIVGQQWIAQYATGGTSQVMCQPTSAGDTYILWDSTVIKLNSDGNKTFANVLNDYLYVYCSYADASNNLYVAGNMAGVPQVVKYNSAGTILWQKSFGGSNIVSMQVTTSGDVFVLIGDIPPVTVYNGPYIVMKLNSSGTVLSQRRLLKSATSATTNLYIDNTNSKLYITGTDFATGRGQILNAVYDLSNSDTASSMVYQSSTTDKYYTSNVIYPSKTIVTDGTYVYQIGQRLIGTTTRSVYMKINKSTGAISYSNQISISGIACSIYGITMDTSGNFYLYGNVSSSDTGLGFVCKVRMSDGVILWAKTLGTTQQFVWDMSYSGGFLYMTTEVVSGGYRSACIKLKSDGSLPDATYNTYWKFTSVTPTTASYDGQTTGTTTGTNTTTAYGSAATTYTTSTASVTITTTNIP